MELFGNVARIGKTTQKQIQCICSGQKTALAKCGQRQKQVQENHKWKKKCELKGWNQWNQTKIEKKRSSKPNFSYPVAQIVVVFLKRQWIPHNSLATGQRQRPFFTFKSNPGCFATWRCWSNLLGCVVSLCNTTPSQPSRPVHVETLLELPVHFPKILGVQPSRKSTPISQKPTVRHHLIQTNLESASDNSNGKLVVWKHLKAIVVISSQIRCYMDKIKPW